MKALLLLSALFFQTGLIAQNTNFVTVSAGTKIMDVLTAADVLFYTQFTQGKIFFRDGTIADAKLNYNCLFDEMHFINPEGDTFALANEKDIKLISIAEDTFYYEQGYVRLLTSNNNVKLAGKQIWSVGAGRMNVAFNTSSTTSAITAYTSLNTAGSRYGSVVNEDVDLTKKDQYFFGDKFNHFVLAGKKNLMMLFPKKQRQIETFLKENKVNFASREDLDRVIFFLGQL